MSRTLITAIIFSFVLVVFALQNVDIVDVDLYFWHYESSLAIVVLVSFAIGAVVGILFSAPGYVRKNRELKDLKKRFFKETAQNTSHKIGNPADNKSSTHTSDDIETAGKGMGSF